MSARALHCAFEQVSSVRSYSDSLADVLARVVQTVIDCSRHHGGIKRQAADGRVEEIGFLFRQAADDVFDGNIILIAPLRFAQGVLKYSLSALAKLIFVCFQIGHSDYLASSSKTQRRSFQTARNSVRRAPL